MSENVIAEGTASPIPTENGDGASSSERGTQQDQETTRCPYCAEEIRAAAIRCRHCRSRLAGFDRQGWHRDHEDARLAGVAAAVARAFHVPVAMVRLGFVVLTFMNFLGPLLYLFGWAVIPQTSRHGSLAEGLASSLGSTLRHERAQWRTRHGHDCQHPECRAAGAKAPAQEETDAARQGCTT